MLSPSYGPCLAEVAYLETRPPPPRVPASVVRPRRADRPPPSPAAVNEAMKRGGGHGPHRAAPGLSPRRPSSGPAVVHHRKPEPRVANLLCGASLNRTDDDASRLSPYAAYPKPPHWNHPGYYQWRQDTVRPTVYTWTHCRPWVGGNHGDTRGAG